LWVDPKVFVVKTVVGWVHPKVFGVKSVGEIRRIFPLKYAILSFEKCLNYYILGFLSDDALLSVVTTLN